MEFVQLGDYYVPSLKVEEETRSIGHWGRLYRTYLQEQHPITFNTLLLSGKLYHRLADINEEVTERLEQLIHTIYSANLIESESYFSFGFSLGLELQHEIQRQLQCFAE